MATTLFTKDPRKILPAFEFGDKVFECSQITAADLLHLQEALDLEHPGARIHVMQPCYNRGVRLSAGTHDKDAVLDISISGLTWAEAEKFCRKHGWAAWWRHTGDWASPSAYHIHMISLAAYNAVGDANVGIFIPAQVDDYRRHALGLAGQHDSGDDPTWHPANIDATIFHYGKWLIKQEDNMPYKDWPQADKDALVKDVTAGFLNATVGPADDATPVRTALYRASNVPDLIRAKTDSAIKAVVKKLS